MLHRLGHGGLGDRIKGDAFDLLGQRLLLRQQFAHVPADRLAFTVRVSRQDQTVCGLGRIGDRLHLPGLVAIQLPVHREVFVGPDRAVFRWQIADVAEARKDFEILAEVAFDGLRFGGRFDDDKLHDGYCNPYAYTYARGWGRFGGAVKGSVEHLFELHIVGVGHAVGSSAKDPREQRACCGQHIEDDQTGKAFNVIFRRDRQKTHDDQADYRQG